MLVKDKLLENQLDICLAECISSTNDFLKNRVWRAERMTICLAEQQTEGRGREQKTWHSPYGCNIYFSCQWISFQAPDRLSHLSLVTALSIIKTLELHDINGLKIKWPNDILYDHKKLSGNLIEIISPDKLNKTETRLIIGIGINVNMDSKALLEIDKPSTSISQIIRENKDRNNIIATLIQTLNENLVIYENNGWQAFTAAWQRYDFLYGKKITLRTATAPVTGIGKGVNENGQLLLALDNHTVQAYSAGDISIQNAFA